MKATTGQTADGEVLKHLMMPPDGYVAGPGHSMAWMMTATTNRPGLEELHVETTGAVLGSRAGTARSCRLGRDFTSRAEGAPC